MEIYTDGSRTPQRSGWGVLIKDGRFYHCLSGEKKGATNNDMELTAFFEALNYCKGKRFPVSIHTDSMYVLNTFFKMKDGTKTKDSAQYEPGSRGWVYGWDLSVDRPNLDLIKKIKEIIPTVKISSITWVKGHKGLEGNEIADQLANGVAPCKLRMD